VLPSCKASFSTVRAHLLARMHLAFNELLDWEATIEWAWLSSHADNGSLNVCRVWSSLRQDFRVWVSLRNSAIIDNTKKLKHRFVAITVEKGGTPWACKARFMKNYAENGSLTMCVQFEAGFRVSMWWQNNLAVNGIYKVLRKILVLQHYLYHYNYL